MLGGGENPFQKKIKGISLGLRESELGIKVDSFISVYGEVLYNLSDNTLRIEHPLAFFFDKIAYIKTLIKDAD